MYIHIRRRRARRCCSCRRCCLWTPSFVEAPFVSSRSVGGSRSSERESARARPWASPRTRAHRLLPEETPPIRYPQKRRGGELKYTYTHTHTHTHTHTNTHTPTVSGHAMARIGCSSYAMTTSRDALSRRFLFCACATACELRAAATFIYILSKLVSRRFETVLFLSRYDSGLSN